MFKRHAEPDTVIECAKHCYDLTEEAHAAFHNIGKDVAEAIKRTKPKYGMRRGGQVVFVIFPDSESTLRKQLKGYCLHASHFTAGDHGALSSLLEPLFKRFKDLFSIRVHGLGEKDTAFGYPVFYVDREDA